MGKIYHNQIEFLYNLTNINQYLSHEGLSKISLITSKTIQNWFTGFKKHKLKYYHSLNLERLGLTNIFMIDENPPEHPTRNSVQEIYNPSTFKKLKIAHYIVPIEKLESFKIKGHRFFTAMNIYPPYHKLLSDKDQFRYDRLTNLSFEKQLSKLEEYIEDIPNITKSDILRKEPMILPISFEAKTKMYSINIWNSIKEKLKNNLRGYTRELTDREGIKKVQMKIQLLNTELNHLVQQIDIEYPQLLSGTQEVSFLLKYNNTKELKDFILKILQHSAKTSIYPNTNDAMIIANINISSIKDILDTHLDVRAFYLGKTLEQNTFDYSKLFNPITKTWNDL